MDTFPECVSKNPRLSFHDHLQHVMAAQNARASAGAARRDRETKAG
jgi:hypothetical protein